MNELPVFPPLPAPEPGRRTSEINVNGRDLIALCQECEQRGITILSLVIGPANGEYRARLHWPDAQKELL